MTAPNDRFWAKVLFKEFIRHFRKLTDEEIIEDVKQSMDDLDDLNDSGVTFGSKMVKWSIERKSHYPNASDNGSLGGRPRINAGASPQHRQAGAAAKHLPNNSEARQSQVEAREGQDAHGGETETFSTKRTTPKRIQTFREPTLTEMYDFCEDNGLDSSYGREWY